MNLPGFNAEASLYRTSGCYHTAVTNVNLPTHIMPQCSLLLRSPPGLCAKADYYCIRGYPNWCDIFYRFCSDWPRFKG